MKPKKERILSPPQLFILDSLHVHTSSRESLVKQQNWSDYPKNLFCTPSHPTHSESRENGINPLKDTRQIKNNCKSDCSQC